MPSLARSHRRNGVPDGAGRASGATVRAERQWVGEGKLGEFEEVEGLYSDSLEGLGRGWFGLSPGIPFGGDRSALQWARFVDDWGTLLRGISEQYATPQGTVASPSSTGDSFDSPPPLISEGKKSDWNRDYRGLTILPDTWVG